MNKRTIRAIEETLLSLLGVLFQVGGYFLVMGGIIVLSTEIIEGQAVTASSLSVVFVTSGIALVLFATLIFKEYERLDEEDYRLTTPLPWPKDSPIRTQPTSARHSETHTCPTCGYGNNREVIFCDACNSPMWTSGTPKGKPPERATVEKRRSRIIAREKATRFLLVGAIIIIATTPAWSYFGVSLAAVSATQLEISEIEPPFSTHPGNVDIGAVIISGGIPVKGELMKPSFTLIEDGVVVKQNACADTTVWGNIRNYVCTVLEVPYSTYLVNKPSLHLSMEAVLRFGLYQASISRSASS